MGRKKGGSSNDPYMSARIRWLMDANKLNVTKLAEKSGLTKGFVSKLVRGKCGVSYTVVEQLAEVLGVTAEQIWDARRPPDAAPPRLPARRL